MANINKNNVRDESSKNVNDQTEKIGPVRTGPDYKSSTKTKAKTCLNQT